MGVRTIADPAVLDEIVRRVGELRSDSPRQWGRMTPHQAVCHLGDALRMVVCDSPPLPPVDNWLTRNVVRYVAIHTPLPWPRGYKTPRGMDQVAGEGTAPRNFDADRGELVRLHRRLAEAAPEALRDRHPIFGALTREEWLIWAYRHADHHLRQFGV
jgi:hypothetical protein